jgi:hypothetical protein
MRWIICVGYDGEEPKPLFTARSQRRADELLKRIRQSGGATRQRDLAVVVRREDLPGFDGWPS